MVQRINAMLRKILESRACYWLVAVAVILSVYADVVFIFPSRLHLIQEMMSNQVVFMISSFALGLTGFLMFAHCLYVSRLSAREKVRWITAILISLLIAAQLYFWIVYRKRIAENSLPVCD